MSGEKRRLLLRIFGTAIATLLVLEGGARVVTGSLLAWGLEEERGTFGRVDPVVGHVTRPGLSVELGPGVRVTTDERGLRRNGGAPTAERPLTLVVGDSFAFGDEVSDDETWPARLEQRTGRRVVNAGMPGFGLDQAVLRAEQLAPALSPEVVIVSFIPHDVLRCEMSIWSGNAKPYFDIGPSGLVYHAPPAVAQLRVAIATPLSYSVLLDTLFHDALQSDGPDTIVHDRGVEVGCGLMERLALLGRERGARIVVVAQPQSPLPDDPRYPADSRGRETNEIVASVLACARDRGLPALDLIPLVTAMAPDRRERLFRGHGHNSPEGNQVVAESVHAFLESLERGEAPRALLPPP